jgi:uncharacterized protein YbcI
MSLSSGLKPTQGQLQRQLAQTFQKLYREQLNHAPGEITCQLLEEKLLVIIEDSVTKPEQLLIQEGGAELAEQVRGDLAAAMKPKIVEIIEDVVDRQVIDVLSDATLETGRTGLVIILSAPPETRPAAPKNMK